MDALECWRRVQNGNSPMLSFAKARIPTPVEAYQYLQVGDPFNCKIQIHDWVSGDTSHYRTFDLKGNKIFVETAPGHLPLPPGSLVHLHFYIIFAFHEDVTILKIGTHSAHRVSLDKQAWLALELCGSTGSMLDAAALIGFCP